MIAKIIKGADFGGCHNYMLSKQEGKAMVLASNNIGFYRPKPMRSRVRSASLHAPERAESPFAIRYSRSLPAMPIN